MSDTLALHARLMDDIVRGNPELESLQQDEQARLTIAFALQDALEQSIQGSDMESIERSLLPAQCGLSPEEIFDLAHAERGAPLAEVMVNVSRVLMATGHTLGAVPMAVAA